MHILYNTPPHASIGKYKKFHDQPASLSSSSSNDELHAHSCHFRKTIHNAIVTARLEKV